MTKRKSRELSVEDMFPSAAGRKAGDLAIDKLDVKEPMSRFIDTWEAAYFSVTKKSPFRGKE